MSTVQRRIFWESIGYRGGEGSEPRFAGPAGLALLTWGPAPHQRLTPRVSDPVLIREGLGHVGVQVARHGTTMTAVPLHHVGAY